MNPAEIPSEGGRLFRLKPVRDSDDPGYFLGVALASACSSGQMANSASRLWRLAAALRRLSPFTRKRERRFEGATV
jgi:hypothetical protein